MKASNFSRIVIIQNKFNINLHQNKKRVNVRDSDLYELKADGEGRGDVEGQAATFEVGEGAEDGRAHDEADVPEGEEVGRANLELANPIVLRHCRVVKLTERLYIIDY
jgi:hypothetical protein